MPAYSFMPQFVDPIRAGTKGGTIRAARKIPVNWSQLARDRRPGGHAIAGELIDLYCRQRHPSGFFICQRRCVGVEHVHLDFRYFKVSLDTSLLLFTSDAYLNAFAVFDGFDDFNEMAAFWRKTHETDTFDGWHIRWLSLPDRLLSNLGQKGSHDPSTGRDPAGRETPKATP